MKNIITALILMTFFASCSTDDSPSTDSPTTDYLPLTDGNYWTYDVSESVPLGRDSVYVANDTMIGSTTHKKMKTRDLFAFGLYTGALRNNGVRNDNGAIRISGNAELSFGDAFHIGLPLQNFVLFDDDATENSQLATQSGTIEQQFGDYPLTIEYAVTNRAKQALPSYTTPNGESYDDVRSVELVMTLEISTTMDVFGFPVNIVILDSQDVVVSTMYFAKNIGMVHSSSAISYDLEDFSQANIELPIPSSASYSLQEHLFSYQVE